MKDIYMLACAVILAGVFIISSCWNDIHILAPLAILGGGGCIIAGVILFVLGITA